MSRLATNNPTHRGIMTQALGIVHVLVSGKPTEHGLPQQTDQRMAAVLASARVGEHLTRQRGQPERIVKFAIGEQPSIGGDQTRYYDIREQRAEIAKARESISAS